MPRLERVPGNKNTGSRCLQPHRARSNQGYIIGYYPTNKDHDGKRRRIAIEVKGHPDYLITSRKWYYAPDQLAI
jgi:hypothetical protein